MWEAFRNREAIEEIKAVQPFARDNIFLTDCLGFAERIQANRFSMFGESSGEYKEKVIHGDISRVQESDEFLAKFEEEVPRSRTWVNTAELVGSLPIVPAFLAGVPNNMRQRVRVRRPAGPLSIFLECTGSAGSMGSAANARGAAMLALVRILNEYRAVDLWLCVTYGDRGVMHGMLIRVETRPLDLARAAHMLAALHDTAFVGANVLRGAGCQWQHGWSYGVPELERKWCGEIFKRFLHPGSDVLYVPAAYLADNWRDPTQWLKDMLERYGGETIEREED